MMILWILHYTQTDFVVILASNMGRGEVKDVTTHDQTTQ